MKRLLLMLLLVFLVLPIVVRADDYYYTTNSSKITITHYIGSGGVVTIPATINGLPVVSIGTNAFASCSSLTSINISGNVTLVDNQAFAGCANLTNVIIGNSVTNIGYQAFAFCTSLPGVMTGNSVSSIGDGAFHSCNHLTNVIIPNSVTSIRSNTFYNCTSLANVTIGNSVASIGVEAFQNCSGLTNVTIPGSVTTIGDRAFYSCASLGSITILGNVASIGDWAFYSCTSLSGVYFTGNAPVLVGTNVFFKDGTTVVYYYPWKSGWTSSLGGRPTAIWQDIPDFIYAYNGTITISRYIGSGGAVFIPDLIHGIQVTNIGSNSCDHCTNLTSVTIPSSVTGIGAAAFRDCSSLASIVIPSSVTSIRSNTFYDCTSLTNVTIPSSVLTIEDNAFGSCTNLSGVYFTGNAPVLGGVNVFSNDNSAIVFYLFGTTGWAATFGGRPTELLNPQVTSTNFGSWTNQFGFNITGVSNLVIVVESCTNLSNSVWFPEATNILTGGSSYFSDPQWTNHPCRFYRLRML